MAVENRNLGTAERKDKATLDLVATATSKTYSMGVMPRAMQIKDAYATCAGISGAAAGTLKLIRLIAGAGATTISISGALTHVIQGSIGTQQLSLPAAGSSLLDLAKNDLLVWVTSGANTAVDTLNVTVVLENIQGIRSWF